MKKFSMFPAGIKNTNSTGTTILVELYVLLRNDNWLKERTIFLRSLESKDKQNAFKGAELEYVTFGGTFSIRKDSGLIKESGLICIDLDGINNPTELKRRIAENSEFLLLAF